MSSMAGRQVISPLFSCHRNKMEIRSRAKKLSALLTLIFILQQPEIIPPCSSRECLWPSSILIFCCWQKQSRSWGIHGACSKIACEVAHLLASPNIQNRLIWKTAGGEYKPRHHGLAYDGISCLYSVLTVQIHQLTRNLLPSDTSPGFNQDMI